MLRVIDVSSAQGLINIKPIDTDAVITKATGGTTYVNDCCDYVIQQCIKLGKPWGFYHYAHEFGHINDPVKEVDYFISNTSNYFHHGLVALDYEVALNGRNYNNDDVQWCVSFIKRVIEKTGVIPLLYISKSLISETNWKPVTDLSVAGWIAQYADNNPTGWNSNPWTDNKPFSPFTLAMQQYTSHGRINGYNGNLDLSIFYGDVKAWNAYAQVNVPQIHSSSDNKPKSTVPNDYLTAFAKDILSGKYGNGSERKENIYNAVQNRVNELLKK